VESSRAAVALGRRETGSAVSWLSAEAGPAVDELVSRAGVGRYDLVVLDPPRTGAREVMEPLARLLPARVLYVSCDAMTLARDARLLVERGYALRRVCMVDTMPQTAHFEIVAELVRDPA